MSKVFVIAEIGINHNGDIDICKKLIDLAKETDCDAVKFQKRDIDTVYTQEYLSQERESPWGSTQRQQKEGLEFSYEEYQKISEYCKIKEIEWLASPWDLKSVDFLEQFKLNYNKIASPMIVFKDLLEKVSLQKKHTFISTGMSNLEDIDEAVNIFKKNNCSFELMHCVSTYPMSSEDANLKTINALKAKYKCDVGYSGHENGVIVSLAAVSLNISSLERHITLDRTMYGSDQAASLEFKGMVELNNSIKKMLLSFGEEKIGHITEEEKKIANKLRAHLKLG